MIYMLLAVALVVVKVVAKALLLLQKKPPPEAYKPPGPPKLAIKVICLGSYMLGPAPDKRCKTHEVLTDAKPKKS